jgi:hypothetical protein
VDTDNEDQDLAPVVPAMVIAAAVICFVLGVLPWLVSKVLS